MSNPSRRFINPDSISQPRGYTHVVEAAGTHTVYISGQVPLDHEGKLVGGQDMGAQAEQVFKNLEAALSAVDATFEDVVKFTYFLTDISQIQAVRNVRDLYINATNPPASSAVQVSQLFMPGLLIEVEVIAVITR
jgi:reactive intermediate/imine deaminase